MRSLVLIGTTAGPEIFANAVQFRTMNAIARFLGFSLLVDPTMRIMFGRSTLADATRMAEHRAWRATLVANRRDIWRAVNGVIDRQGVAAELSSIKAPTLVLVGEEVQSLCRKRWLQCTRQSMDRDWSAFPPAAIQRRGNSPRPSMQPFRFPRGTIPVANMAPGDLCASLMRKCHRTLLRP